MKNFDLVGTISTVPMLIEVGINSRFQAFGQFVHEACAKPGTVRARLAAALRKVMRNPEVQARLTELGATAFAGEHDTFMEAMKPLDALAKRYKAEGSLSAR